MKLSYRNQRNAEIIARYWNKPLDKADWFEIKNQTDDEAEILVYDIIGWPYIEAQDFIKVLNDFGNKDLLVRINSPGGDVWDAFAIYNALSDYKGKVTTRIESLAASSASIIAVSGNVVQSYKNAMMMVHEAWTIAIGNQYDFRELADFLSKISNNSIDIYADNSNIGKRTIKQMMKDETWFTASEMKDHGLISEIIEGKGAKAKFDLSIFNNLPDGIKDKGDDLTIRDAEKALRDVGFSQNKAKSLLARGWKDDSENQRDVERQGEIQNTLNDLASIA